jgi:hypothetical protein
LFLCLALALACSSIAAAQPPPARPGAPAAQPPPGKPGPDPRALPPPEPMGQPINVRVELAITDQFAAGDPLKKAVTMIAADRARSSVRNDAGSRGFLNADAQPLVLTSGAIRLVLGFEYMPTVVTSGTEVARTLSRLNEQVTVILESGKPLVISQAGDPSSERRVTVQVTATVVR